MNVLEIPKVEIKSFQAEKLSEDPLFRRRESGNIPTYTFKSK
jgi:hypothetical protein